MYSPASEAELSAILADHHARLEPVVVQGGGSRGVVDRLSGDQLTTSALSGVVDYQPGEMTLIARTGTPLAEIEALLEGSSQHLAFEPPDLRLALGRKNAPTLGGMAATNASGPRRPLVGAARDHILGIRLVDGQGRILKNGGRVMKNVTGLDLSRLLAGSHGTLGVLTEIAFKTLPRPEATLTLVLPGLNAVTAQTLFSEVLSTPYEVSGAAYQTGTMWLRLEGLPPQVTLRRDKMLRLLGQHEVQEISGDASRRLWLSIRDLHAFCDHDQPLWRILSRARDGAAIADMLDHMGGKTMIDWGGGLIWYQGHSDPEVIRRIAPHATLIRHGGLTAPRFPLEASGVARLAEGLRRTFDPGRILNPGLMAAKTAKA